MILTIVHILSFIAVGLTVFQLLPYRHWIFRAPEYMCTQLLGSSIVLLLFECIIGFHQGPAWIIIMALAVCIILLSKKIYPFTRFGSKSVPDYQGKSPENKLSICVINVLQKNEHYEKVRSCIIKSEADIVLLLEVNEKWVSNLTTLSSSYPYVINRSREDTYGMLLLSKLVFKDFDIHHIYDETPQIECILRKYGTDIHFFGLHPKPPVPGESSTSLPKDVELAATANRINELSYKDYLVVAGDINDVAWSRATTKFVNNSRLHDPRQGRGMITTFPTYAPWLGFPLDQIFCSKKFSLINIKRLEKVGSDHYPLLVELNLEK